MHRFTRGIAYGINIGHPILQEVNYTLKKEDHYSGPYEKIHFYHFIQRLTEEKLKEIDPLSITTTKHTYYLQNKNVHDVIEMYLQLIKQGKDLMNCDWYLYGYRSSPDYDIGPFYLFFIAGSDQIEFGSVALECREDTDFTLLKSPDYENDSDNYDEEYDKAVSRYWYKRFYSETKVGQIEAIREEMVNEEIADSEAAGNVESPDERLGQIAIEEPADTASEHSSNNNLDTRSLLSSVNRKLSFIVLVLIVLAILQFFR